MFEIWIIHISTFWSESRFQALVFENWIHSGTVMFAKGEDPSSKIATRTEILRRIYSLCGLAVCGCCANETCWHFRDFTIIRAGISIEDYVSSWLVITLSPVRVTKGRDECRDGFFILTALTLLSRWIVEQEWTRKYSRNIFLNFQRNRDGLIDTESQTSQQLKIITLLTRVVVPRKSDRFPLMRIEDTRTLRKLSNHLCPHYVIMFKTATPLLIIP